MSGEATEKFLAGQVAAPDIMKAFQDLESSCKGGAPNKIIVTNQKTADALNLLMKDQGS
jgi:hypothetical protein